jgi:hypothetical protein
MITFWHSWEAQKYIIFLTILLNYLIPLPLIKGI